VKVVPAGGLTMGVPQLAYLLAYSINHGINLRKTTVLQYLYYICQIGLSVSPLSNNALFLKYTKNPFPQFFARGLFVTLSSDDPLMFHHTGEPLLEEYSIAKAIYGLSVADVCEIARNSVLQSGFTDHQKKHWLGPDLKSPNKSNVPHMRIEYRRKVYEDELHEVGLLGEEPSPVSPVPGTVGSAQLAASRATLEVDVLNLDSDEPENALSRLISGANVYPNLEADVKVARVEDMDDDEDRVDTANATSVANLAKGISYLRPVAAEVNSEARSRTTEHQSVTTEAEVSAGHGSLWQDPRTCALVALAAVLFLIWRHFLGISHETARP